MPARPSRWRRCCWKLRSPHGAKRNAGSAVTSARPLPDFASLHPGYEAETHRKFGTIFFTVSMVAGGVSYSCATSRLRWSGGR